MQEPGAGISTKQEASRTVAHATLDAFPFSDLSHLCQQVVSNQTLRDNDRNYIPVVETIFHRRGIFRLRLIQRQSMCLSSYFYVNKLEVKKPDRVLEPSFSQIKRPILIAGEQHAARQPPMTSRLLGQF